MKPYKIHLTIDRAKKYQKSRGNRPAQDWQYFPVGYCTQSLSNYLRSLVTELSEANKQWNLKFQKSGADTWSWRGWTVLWGAMWRETRSDFRPAIQVVVIQWDTGLEWLLQSNLCLPLHLILVLLDKWRSEVTTGITARIITSTVWNWK